MNMIRNNKGLTVLEILMAVLILLPVFVGTMYVFVKCTESSEISRNASIVNLSIRNKLTEIENSTYSQIHTVYDNATFKIADILKKKDNEGVNVKVFLDGIGVVYIDNTDPDLLEVKVVFCWREKNGRFVGEDINKNGVLDAGEDLNGNGEIDSTTQISTLIDNT